MLARVLAMGICVSVCVCVCVSVCLSVYLSHAGIVSKRLHKSSWFFCVHVSHDYPTLRFTDIRDTSLWNFVPNSGHTKFGQGTSIVAKHKQSPVVGQLLTSSEW